MNKNRSGLLLAVFCLVALVGCASHKVTRYDPATGHLIERNATSGFLTTAAVKNLNSSTVDNVSTNGAHTYKRSVGVTDAAARTDSDGIDAVTRLFQAGVQSGVQATAAGMGVPIKLPPVPIPARPAQ